MSVEENKAVARRWNEEIAWREFDAYDEVLDKNYTHYFGSDGSWPSDAHGLEQIKKVIGEILREYPNTRASVEDIIGEGDKVAIRFAYFVEGKPTGNGIAFYRFSDGKIVDDWVCFTQLEA